VRILFILMISVSCNYINPMETFEDRIVRQSTQYCSCRNGVNILTFNPYDIYLLCNDGTEHKASGVLREHQIVGCSK
jgi:hypothetical protein